MDVVHIVHKSHTICSRCFLESSAKIDFELKPAMSSEHLHAFCDLKAHKSIDSFTRSHWICQRYQTDVIACIYEGQQQCCSCLCPTRHILNLSALSEKVLIIATINCKLHDTSPSQWSNSHLAGSLYSCSTVARNPTARTCKTGPCHFDMWPPDLTRPFLHECVPLMQGFLLIFDCESILQQRNTGLWSASLW